MTTATPRKIRSDAKLEQLTPAQHEQLLLWLDDENLSYSEVVRKLRQEFGLSVGRTAVAYFYQRHMQPQRCEIESEAATVIARMKNGPFDAATVNYARQLAFSALVQPQPEIDTATKLLNLVRRAEQQDIARERLELQRRLVAVRERQVGIRSRRKAPSVARASAASEAEPLPAQPLPLDASAVQSHAPEAPSTSASSVEPTSLPPASFSAASPTEAVPTTPPSAAPGSVAPHPTAALEPVPAAIPRPTATAQKLPQNPPLYSPYFALNRAQPPRNFAPILEIAIHSLEFADATTCPPAQEAAPGEDCPTDFIPEPDAPCAA